MLIYNYKKEFLGIDEADLEALGLNTLADLRAESADFADLFVKTPGCIHNFKHVHWIDYVLDKNGAEAKVIIHIQNKNYAANLNINTAYLVDSPAEKAFSVVLSNIRALSSAQAEKLLSDINEKPAPQPASGNTELFTTPGSIIHDGTASEIEEEMSEVAFDPYEAENSTPTSSTVQDVYETETEIAVEDLTADDAPLDVELEELSYKEEELEEVTPVVVEETKEEVPSIDGKFANYKYNPEVASEELGLPIDLIEEFIQDFIAQAESFKDELYASVDNQEADNIKIQSHKLKGVAANLRIEDALDAISVVNTSSDYDEITEQLNRFFIMIDKLSGKIASPDDIRETSTEIIEEDDEDDEDEFVLSFKEDTPSIKETETILDKDVPQSISIPELADDEFLTEEKTEIVNEDLSILDDAVEDSDDTTQEEALDIALSYDKELIANDIGLDIDSFNELFDDYMKEAKELSETIIQSADNNDLTICKSLASKLKGMSENMRIHKLDSELEDIINTSDTNQIKNAVNTIQTKLAQIQNAED